MGGSTATLLGHNDPGSARGIHEHSNTLRPCSPRSPTCHSARSVLAKSQDLNDFAEPSPTSMPSSPKSSKHSGVGSSVSPRPSKWKRAMAVLAKPQESSHDSLKHTSAAPTLVRSQDMSLSTNSPQVACQKDCTIDEHARRGQPLKATLIIGHRSSRGLSSRSRRLARLPSVRSGKSSSKAPRRKLFWGDEIPL